MKKPSPRGAAGASFVFVCVFLFSSSSVLVDGSALRGSSESLLLDDGDAGALKEPPLAYFPHHGDDRENSGRRVRGLSNRALAPISPELVKEENQGYVEAKTSPIVVKAPEEAAKDPLRLPGGKQGPVEGAKDPLRLPGGKQ
ncbi:hypothetical protein VYU27_010133, partial [Nannochloropsis oceanica]